MSTQPSQLPHAGSAVRSCVASAFAGSRPPWCAGSFVARLTKAMGGRPGAEELPWLGWLAGRAQAG
ncbi:hypothetical protein [Kribbella sp. NPDC051718]|uniref:hypothetical protein n=1 Tax=Kribbella sp. NPDC051718 TaxID=3155168 RepID=UPI0034226E50